MVLLLPRQIVVVVIWLLAGRRIKCINPLLHLSLVMWLLLRLLLVRMGMVGVMQMLIGVVATHWWHRCWQWRRII